MTGKAETKGTTVEAKRFTELELATVTGHHSSVALANAQVELAQTKIELLSAQFQASVKELGRIKGAAESNRDQGIKAAKAFTSAMATKYDVTEPIEYETKTGEILEPPTPSE